MQEVVYLPVSRIALPGISGITFKQFWDYGKCDECAFCTMNVNTNIPYYSRICAPYESLIGKMQNGKNFVLIKKKV